MVSLQLNPISYKTEKTRASDILFSSKSSVKVIQGEGELGSRLSFVGFGGRMGTLESKLPQQSLITSWQFLSFSSGTHSALCHQLNISWSKERRLFPYFFHTPYQAQHLEWERNSPQVSCQRRLCPNLYTKHMDILQSYWVEQRTLSPEVSSQKGEALSVSINTLV